MENSVRFSLQIDGIDSEIKVLKFNSQEELSNPYIYKIKFNSTDSELSLKDAVKKPAKLTLKLGGNYTRSITGYIKKISQAEQVAKRSIYYLEIVPQISFAERQVFNQIFLEKSIDEILPELMEQMGLESSEFNICLNESYPTKEIITQYNNSTLSFMQRWLARVGMYYFFDVEKDNNCLIVADNNSFSKSVLYFDEQSFKELRGRPVFDERVIWDVQIDYRQIPRTVLLRNYNYHKSSMDLEYKKVIEQDGKGDIYYFGENFKTEDEAEFLAAIRAESEICQSMVLRGKSNNPAFAPGYKFTMKNYYRKDVNQEYLIIRTTSRGINADEMMTESGSSETGDGMNFLVEFEAIPYETQYRSVFSQTIGIAPGIINGRIDSPGDGEYAEIDEEGRYTIILPYDKSGRRDGKASCRLRKSETYLGDDYGIHFPLHKNSEVLISFEDGDPDRPVIIGAVHNSENKNPVIDENHTQSIIRTAGGNEIIIDDEKENELISIYGKKDEKIEIENDRAVNIKNNDSEEVGNDQTLKVINDQQINIGNNKNIEIGNDYTEAIANDYSTEVKGKLNQKIAKDTRKEFKGKLDEIIEKDNNLKNNSNYNMDTAKKMIIKAGDKLQIKCGSSEIVLEKSGKIQIKGTNVTVKASGTLTLKGAKIGEN